MRAFNGSYQELLLEKYPEQVVGQITSEPFMAPSDAQQAIEIPYVIADSTKEPDSDPTIFYIPGFGEGIVNKASFAAELAVKGASVVLPGQNRKGILRNAEGELDAAYTQAQNYLSVMRHVSRSGRQISCMLPHSYGSPVFDAMAEIEPDLFNDIDVVMLAPSGFIDEETYPRMGRRWIGMLKSESDKKRPMEFPDPRNVTGAASVKELVRNPRRTLHEIRDLKRKRVNFAGLVGKVGSLTVMTYAEDAMFPEEEMERTLSEAVQHGVGWTTPVSPQGVLDGFFSYTGEAATHDDEQFNPSRVTDAVLQLIK
jgi:hypothetical protein